MKKVMGPLVFVVIMILFSVYGIGFLAYHRTKITEQEIYISRIGAIPFSTTEYAINLETGDEMILIAKPPLFGQSWHITYDGERECITEVYKHGDYYVSLNDDDTVFYSAGKTVHKTISYEEARSKFEEGKNIRNTFIRRYEGYRPLH